MGGAQTCPGRVTAIRGGASVARHYTSHTHGLCVGAPASVRAHGGGAGDGAAGTGVPVAYRTMATHSGGLRWGSRQAPGPRERRKGERSVPAVLNSELTAPTATAHSILTLWEARGSEFDGVNYATAVSRLARLHADARARRVRALRHDIEAHLRDGDVVFRPRELAAIAHGWARLGVRGYGVFQAVAAAAVRQAAAFDSQAMSNITWAFARAGVEASEMFYRIADEARPKLHTFSAQGLANMVWAFATLRVPAPELYAGVAQEACARLDEFTPQLAASAVWAVAASRTAAPELYAGVAERASGHLTMFSALGVARVAWAFGRSGAALAHPEFFAALAAEATARAPEFGPAAVVHAVTGFAAAGVSAPALFAAVARRVEAGVGLRPEQAAAVVAAYEEAGEACPKMPDPKLPDPAAPA